VPATDSCLDFPCYLYITVEAFTDTSFTIVVTASDMSMLQDGVSQAGYVRKHAMFYYYFQVRFKLLSG